MSIIEIYEINTVVELQYLDYNKDHIYISFANEKLLLEWFRDAHKHLNNNVILYGLSVKNIYGNEFDNLITLRLKVDPIKNINSKYDSSINPEYWELNCNVSSISLIHKLFFICPNTDIKIVYIWTLDYILNMIDYKRKIRNRISNLVKLDKIIVTDYNYDELGLVTNLLIDKIKRLMIIRRYKNLRNLGVLKHGLILWPHFFKQNQCCNYYTTDFDVVERLNFMDIDILRSCLDDLKIIHSYNIKWN